MWPEERFYFKFINNACRQNKYINNIKNSTNNIYRYF